MPEVQPLQAKPKL